MHKVRLPSPFFGELMNAYLPFAPWWIDRLVISKGQLEVLGWALAPDGLRDGMTFACNARPFEHVEFPSERDVSEAHPYWPGAERAGFRLVSSEPAYTDGASPLRLERIWKATGRSAAPGSEYFYPATEGEPPLPDAERMHRVSGNKNPHVFRLAGYTAWRLFNRLLERHFGRGFAGYPAIMDWGVGCGRLARHFGNTLNTRVTGVDVDADNVGWCRNALPFLQSAEAIPLHPPTNLGAATFDLVVGISVLTHLRPTEQLEWLAELHRVTKPGGVLLLTTLGQSAFGWMPANEAVVGKWLRDGIFYGNHNDQLDSQIAEKGYYTDTYLHPRFVVASWSKWFEVVAIERGYLFGHQDVVVLVNKASTENP